MQFIPSVEIEFCGPDGEVQKRELRFDLAAHRVLRSLYPDHERLSDLEFGEALDSYLKTDPLQFIVKALFAMTYHERKEGESPESFEPFIGFQNMKYLIGCVRSAFGMGADDEPADPTTAPNGSVKRSRTGKRSKPSPKSVSESRPTDSIQ